MSTEAPTSVRLATKPQVRTTGLVPPIATPLLDGELDPESLAKELADLDGYVSGVLVGGSVGESPSLSIDERVRLMRLVRDRWDTNKFLAVSIADNSLEHTRRLAMAAADVSANLLVVSAPSYFQNDREMLLEYLAAVSALTSTDLCLYDNPVATNTHLTVEDIVAFAERVTRLTHIKVTDTSLSKVSEIKERTSLVVLGGDDAVLWHHLHLGVEGAMVALPMIYPAQAAGIWKEISAGNTAGAEALYREVSHFIHCALGASDYVAVIKQVLFARGVIASPEVRLPLRPLSALRRDEVMSALGKGVAIDASGTER